MRTVQRKMGEGKKEEEKERKRKNKGKYLLACIFLRHICSN
jgi:hypothetical protein